MTAAEKKENKQKAIKNNCSKAYNWGDENFSSTQEKFY